MKKITLLFTLFAFSFGFSQNGGDDCASAVVAAPGTFTNTTMTGDGTTNNGSSTWFVYTAAADGTIDIQSCIDVDDTDTRVFVFDECGGTQLATDDDGCGDVTADPDTFESAILGLAVVAGEDYFIQWDDRWSEDPFDWTLTYTPPPSCAEVSALFIDTLTDVSLDFSWDAPTSGTGTIVGYNWEVQPDGVAQGTAGALATGSGAATTGATGNVLTAATPYDLFIQTDCTPDGMSAYVGPINFTTNALPPPANDTCATATTIACGGGPYPGDTANANFEAVGDCGSVDNDGPNVFYTFTGTGSAENVTVSTCNDADFDTSIAVYTGACGALVCYANNDDGAGCAGFSSELTFLSDGTTTYIVMVEGFNGDDTGTFNLTVTCTPASMPPANNDCANAQAVTLNAAAIAGTNVDATTSIVNPSCDLFGTINDVWYSFVAPASGNVTVTTTLTTALQANVTVWDDCAFTTELGCADDAGGESLDITGLTGGQTYFVQVWNDAGAAPTEAGTFTVAVDETLSIPSIDTNTFKYFPNPVNDNLSLRAQNNIENVTIYNMLGQQVTRMAPNALSSEVDMSNLSQGAYFVKVTINGNTETIRILKK